RRPLVRAEVIFAEDVVEPAHPNLHSGTEQFSDQFVLLVRSRSTQTVPGFNDDDGALREGTCLVHCDQLSELASLAVFILVTRSSFVREDLRQGGEVVPLAEVAEHLVLPGLAIAVGLLRIGEPAVRNGDTS